MSKWSLKYTVFDRDVEFSWLARNLQVGKSHFIYFLFVYLFIISFFRCFCFKFWTSNYSRSQIKRFTGGHWKAYQIGTSILWCYHANFSVNTIPYHAIQLHCGVNSLGHSCKTGTKENEIIGKLEKTSRKIWPLPFWVGSCVVSFFV